MLLGFLALLAALAAAGWLLWRAARGRVETAGARNVTLLKGVVFLGLAAALFAAKLWPLAFMTLVAAAAVTAIEIWRERTIRREEGGGAVVVRPAMKVDEAASILGVEPSADAEAIRAAHRKLIGQLHPDKGGTDYLAAKINDARDTLLAHAPATPAQE